MKKDNLLPLSVIKPRLLGCPARSQVTTPTEISQQAITVVVQHFKNLVVIINYVYKKMPIQYIKLLHECFKSDKFRWIKTIPAFLRYEHPVLISFN